MILVDANLQLYAYQRAALAAVSLRYDLPGEAAPQGGGRRPRSGMPHALLVDDDEAFLTALAEAVARESFSTHTATSLAAAKMAIAGGAPDVVLVDLHLPDGNGMELLEDLSAFLAASLPWARQKTAEDALAVVCATSARSTDPRARVGGGHPRRDGDQVRLVVAVRAGHP